MRLRRLKLTGFKSFVDPAELVIEPGLTGIVGPNGCGKSNLLEALRWVMGEASPKSLRGAGMEDVIFAGTAQRPARDFAEVAMLIDRPDAGGHQECEVVRRIERGVGSVYRLDGRDVRQKDVALLFADAATGAHSPALVGQGRIGAIIAARPQDRRAMLEEAAGIAGLHVRRRDAEQKLRATEFNLERLDTLLQDMAARAASLRRQARSAEKYRALSSDIRVAEGRLTYARWRDAAAAAANAKQEAARAEAGAAAAAAAQRLASERAVAAAATLAEARSAAQARRDAAAAAGYALETIRTEQAALDRRLAEFGRLHQTLAHDRERESALAEDAAAAVTRLRDEDAALASRIEAAAAARPALVGRLAESEAGLRDAEVALAQGLAADAAEQADAHIARAALAAARQRLDRADAETARIARDAAAIGDAGHHDAALARAIADREQATADAGRTADAIEAAEAEQAGAAAARDAAQAESAAARALLASLESEAKAIRRPPPVRGATRRALDEVRAASGYERALAAALGDDLEAAIGEIGRSRWTGAAAAGDPPLPALCTALGGYVEAPAALARRLAQIMVVDADDGSIVLAVGQRLVTRDGRLRRWDGFVAEDRGAAVAEGLIRRNRLAEIEARIGPVRTLVTAAETAMREAAAAHALARQEGQAARADRGRAEARLREAILAEDRARLAIERIAIRRAELDERGRAVAAERAAAAAAADAAASAVAALPDGERARRHLADRRAAAEAARLTVVRLRADLADLDRGLAADRDRRAAAVAEAEGWGARSDDAARRIAEMTARADAADREFARLAASPAALEARRVAATAEQAAIGAGAAAATAVEGEADAAFRDAEAALAAAGEASATMREQRAAALARRETQELRLVEMGRVAEERFGCPASTLPAVAGFAAGAVGEVEHEAPRLATLSHERERIGPVNLVAERELAELEADRSSQAADRDELATAVARLRGSIGSLNREGRVRLLAAFDAVDGHFRRLFARLFVGGEAHLALIDSDDPLEAGLEIMAQPPGKKLASLTLLSGGEQALTAVALIFALFLTNPAPICVLDEVDAPLDDANVERFCDLLDQMCRETDTRYLVVTHNAVSMARMHRLFGVTMVERGVSRLVSVDLGGAETLLAAE